jgi:hypothetical protein
MKTTRDFVAMALVAGTLMSGSLWAQRTSRLGETELGFYTGATFDLPGAASYVGASVTRAGAIDRDIRYLPGKKALPILGGGAAVALHKVLWAYGDYSYMFPDRSAATISRLMSGVNTVNRHYWMADGGVQLTFPTVQRVMPYVSIGIGKWHQNYSSTRKYGSSSPTYSRTVNDAVTPHVGAGVRVFLTERSGFKFTVDGYRSGKAISNIVEGVADSYVSTVRRGFGRITAGYFVRIGKR